MHPNQGFVDPAIMSMSMNPMFRDGGYNAGPMNPQLSPHGMPGPMGLGHLPAPPGISSMDGMPGFTRKQSNTINTMPMASPSNQQSTSGKFSHFAQRRNRDGIPRESFSNIRNSSKGRYFNPL